MKIRFTTTIAIVLGMLVCFAVGKERSRDHSETAAGTSPSRISANRISRVLATAYSCRFEDVSLREVLEKIEEEKQISIWIDTKELSDAGVSIDQTVSLKVRSVTLRNALDLILEPLTLTYVIDCGVLKITTHEKSEGTMFTRVYSVRGLINENNYQQSYMALMRTIQQTTPGKWEDQDGEGGRIAPLHIANALVIRQSQRFHSDVESIMAGIRRTMQLPQSTSIATDPDDVEGLLNERNEPRQCEGRGEVQSHLE